MTVTAEQNQNDGQPKSDTAFRRAVLPLSFVGLIAAYACIWLFAEIDTELVKLIWFVPLIGVFGAIVANSTGVGGGVVFIPVFHILSAQGHISVTTATIVGVSFLIQSFGMTTGSLSWIKKIGDITSSNPASVPTRDFISIIAVSLLGALPTMLMTQQMALFSQEETLILFKGFSLALGVALLLANLSTRPHVIKTSVLKGDLIVLFILGLFGGVATALFSVGVGELMALYLFLRNYPLITAVAPAVMVSAISVIIGGFHHITGGTVLWEIIVLAVPGAMCGAWIARHFATAIKLRTLKLLTASWIILSSLWLIL